MDAMLISLRQASMEVLDTEDECMIPAIVPRSRLEEGNIKIMEIVNDTVTKLAATVSSAIEPVLDRTATPEFVKSLLHDLKLKRQAFAAANHSEMVQEIDSRIREVCSVAAPNLRHLRELQNSAAKLVDHCLLSEVNVCLAFVDIGRVLPNPLEWPPICRVEASRVFSGTVRSALFSYIESTFGVGLSQLAADEESARVCREKVYRVYSEHVVPAQRERDSMGYLRYVLQGSRYYRYHGFPRRVHTSNPAGYYSTLMRAILTSGTTLEPLYSF
jgi:hypothetical protein